MSKLDLDKLSEEFKEILYKITKEDVEEWVRKDREEQERIHKSNIEVMRSDYKDWCIKNLTESLRLIKEVRPVMSGLGGLEIMLKERLEFLKTF